MRSKISHRLFAPIITSCLALPGLTLAQSSQGQPDGEEIVVVEEVETEDPRRSKTKPMELSPEDQAYVNKLNAEFDTWTLTDDLLPPINNSLSIKSGREKLILLNFVYAPLVRFLDFYEQLAGVTTSIEKNLNVNITYRGHKRMTQKETLAVIRRVLEDKGISLTQQTDGTVLVHRSL